MRPACLLALILSAASLAPAPARPAERSSVPLRYQWNLTDLYPSPEAWQRARTDLVARIPALARFQGRLGESADLLYTALSTRMDVEIALQRLKTYASMLSDQDVRDQTSLEMDRAALRLDVDYRGAVAYMQPEILALGAERVKSLVAGDARLKPYTIWLDDIVRWAPHTLDPAQEKIVARAGNLTGIAASIRSVLSNAELPFPEVTLSTGEKVRLDPAGYGLHRASPRREDRLRVFRAYFDLYRRYQGTYGAVLDAQATSHLFYKEVRNFGSCLEAASFKDNIPTQIYHQLIADVHENLPTLHRYLRLRQRMMGLDTLRYEDLYAPIVATVDMRFTPQEAQEVVLKAVAPLGPGYVATVQKSFDERWVDWMPSTGKRSGAYSTGAYGVHPYQLQNFTGLYDDVATLAHESGHSVHTHLAYQAQPYVTAEYSDFVAEVASTVNEALLSEHMLRQARGREQRLFLLASRLDDLRTTLFRQVMFAEFELKMHETAERGEPVTGEKLTALYLGLVREYYGHDQGVCRVDDLYGIEWASVPHFLDYNFYVYEYATSIVASTSLARGILADATAGKPTTKDRDAFLRMLAAGASEYPVELLKDAGVDMTTSAPFRATMAEMNRILDEMETLTQ